MDGPYVGYINITYKYDICVYCTHIIRHIIICMYTYIQIHYIRNIPIIKGFRLNVIVFMNEVQTISSEQTDTLLTQDLALRYLRGCNAR